MVGRINGWGLVIAGVGFFLTRFTVTLALYEDPLSFYFAGLVPLVLGLGLAAFGVALTVADVDPLLVRSAAVWCVVGAGTMLALVVLTLLGSGPEGLSVSTARSQTYLSNFLIGGSVFGTLTGLYAARTRRQRDELGQQANRLEVLNRILRHEVLNALTVIQGRASAGTGGSEDGAGLIRRRSEEIADTISDVQFLTRTTGTSAPPVTRTDLEPCIRRSVSQVRADHPGADIEVGPIPADLTVSATDRLVEVFAQLVENAVVHADSESPTVRVDVEVDGTTVAVSVTDEGPGLPGPKRSLMETGEIESVDDTGSGYGLNVVRFLVESYDGTIETSASAGGSTVTVTLPRGGPEDPSGSPLSRVTGVRPALPHLAVVLGASLVAAVPYGVAAEYLGGSVAAIGVFYGFQHPVVGWITHVFHSAVFGFVFAGLVSALPRRFRDNVLAHVVVGLGWGVVLWTVAAGFVAPFWLGLLGIPARIPSFSPVLLVSHLAWGATLGLVTAAGYRWVTPAIRRLTD